MQKGHIYFILWVSGAGKSTLRKHIKAMNLPNFLIPLSCTTRLKRPDEQHGKDYIFMTREEFHEGIERDEFLEYALVHSAHYYGTRFHDIVEEGSRKWKIVIKEIDIIGLKDMMIHKPELRDEYTTIFLDIPVSILKERIEKRGHEMDHLELDNRLRSAEMETVEGKKICDHVIDATQSEGDVLKEVFKVIRINYPLLEI